MQSRSKNVSNLQFIEKEYCEKNRLKNETLFHTASGQLGIRGCFEEGAPEGAPSVRGAYLNGFSETEPITYNEKLYGFPEEKQVIVNLPDAQTIRITAGGEEVLCWKGSEYRRVLDMENGVCTRSFLFRTSSGRIRVTFTRLVSFVQKNIFAIRCCISSLDFDGKITIASELNANVKNFTDTTDPRVASGSGQMLHTLSQTYANGVMAAEVETINSKRKLLCAVTHDVSGSFSESKGNSPLRFIHNADLHPGSALVFRKYAVYAELFSEEDKKTAILSLTKCQNDGFEKLESDQREFLMAFWSLSRITVPDDEALQEQLDFSIYGMLSCAGTDGRTNVAAKGLSGEGYEGHYFWDSEIYVFPFFLFSEPKTAKALLMYRYRHLNDAKAHARRMGHSFGALYPWRTITGSECSSHYPTGSAQYHINGDIARAFTSYYDATGDMSFLPEACEVLVETARLWLDAGHWLDGKFRIDCVTGPDEYTCLVNNNYYTNACAAANLAAAKRLCGELKKLGSFASFSEKLSLTEEELAEFSRAAEKMFFPYSADGRIIAQDDSFLQKKRWDFRALPDEDFPLLMHYHPLLINRAQVLKQADSVLANYLYREETPLMMMRSYRYYEDVTTHDSSLSNCIYAIMAARLGDLSDAWKYFKNSVGTDINDQNGNTRDGLHIANMGGVYAVMTAGFGGVRLNGTELSIFPLLPKELSGYTFHLSFKNSRIRISVTGNGCTLCVTEGPDIKITVYGEHMCLGHEEITIRRKAKAVLFDLDGVITDTAGLHYRAWKKLADELGIDFNEKKNEQFKGVSRAACLKLLLGWGGMQAEQEEFERLLARKNDYYCDMLDDLTPENILPGVKECLFRLKEQKVPFSVFSVSKNTDRILQKIGLDRTFSIRVTGNDIEFSKPHFEGYLLAAERMNVDPRLCVMVEDSEAGIKGAKALSLFSLAIMQENKAGADVCIDSTAKLASAIQTFFN